MLRHVSLPLVALALSAMPLAAQTPKIFHACYVPETGTVYRIKEPGLPQACVVPHNPHAAPHVEFSWTEGAGAVRAGDAAGGDLSGAFPNPTVNALLGRALAATPPTDGQVLEWDASSGQWVPITPGVAEQADIEAEAAARAAADDALQGHAVNDGDAAGGDLAGAYPNPVVTRIQGHPVAATVPSDGEVLVWDGASGKWTPAAPEADASLQAGITAEEAARIAADAALQADVQAEAAARAAADDALQSAGLDNGDPAGGDLAGTYPSPAVTGIQGRSVSAAAPSDGQVLAWNAASNQWAPAGGLTPVAAASVGADCTLYARTPNITSCQKTDVGTYRITISGATLSSHTHLAMVNLVGNLTTLACALTAVDANGDLVVRILRQNAQISSQEASDFHLVVYAP